MNFRKSKTVADHLKSKIGSNNYHSFQCSQSCRNRIVKIWAFIEFYFQKNPSEEIFDMRWL